MKRHLLTTAILAGFTLSSPLTLTACGGGGNGMVRTAPAPPSPPAPAPAPTPSPAPSPAPPPAAPTYDPAYNQLIPTGVQTAQKEGFTGKGVKVGIMGYGILPTTPPLDGRITWFKSYLSENNQSPNDTSGHGTVVADMLGGLAKGEIPPAWVPPAGQSFPGGVAPEAQLFVEQVCAAGKAGCRWTAANFTDFAAEHVKLVNVSLGALSGRNANVLTAFSGPNDPAIEYYQATFQPAMDADILLIWSAMNENGTEPSLQAGLPHWIPSFQPDWLAVVNIAIDENGNPDGLYRGSIEPSNACGVAAEWCLGAPGYVYFPAVAGTEFQGAGVGTSFAAPIVSGTAALVLQAFPWMSAANLSDTLLTTATPLDDGSHMTPNPTFGWGMVNAAEAVHGPAQFAFPKFGPFTAAIPSGTTSTFSNDISGPGGLKLTGTGSLVLTGNDTFQGGSDIAAGTLFVNGSVASDVSVGTSGNLAGTGTIDADVVNHGTVTSQSTQAGRGLTITGNLTDSVSSTTAVALGDPLQVHGNASVAGTMHILGAPDGYTVKSNENLLTAGKLSGTFDTLTFASSVFYTGTLAYTGTQVNVSLAQANVASAAAGGLPLATSETRLAASHVQNALNVSNRWFTQSGASGHEAWFADAGRFLSASDPALATMSLNSLSGEIYATSRAVEAAQSLAADAAIAHREHDLAHIMTPGVWVQALGANGTLARKGYESANYRANGAMIGMHGRFNATWSAGIALGRTHSNASMTALGGDLDGREDIAAIYARWDAPHGWYAAARTSYASIRNNVHRHVLLGTTLTSLTGNRTDHVTLGAVESGKTMARGAASLTPYVSITDLHLAQGSFAERGSTMGLAAPAQTHDALLGTLGLRYRWSFNWAPGHSSLTGRLAFRHAISGANLAVKASFNGVPDSTFLAQGQNLPRDLGIIGAEFVTRMNTHWSWFIDADYQTGASAHQIEANAGIRLAL